MIHPTLLPMILDHLRARLGPDREGGSVTTEQAVITAGMVVLALTAVGVITALVLSQVNAIDLNGTTPPTTEP